MIGPPRLARRAFLSASALALGSAVSISLRANAAPGNGVGTLTWFGQSCFLLETSRGTKVLMDPLSKGLGFEPPIGLKADLVTISHEHPDHANLSLLASRPRVLRGLTVDKKGWVKIDERFRDVNIRTVGVYHDEKHGADRGLDTIFLFEVGGMRLAHLGDLGHVLTDEQRSDVGAVDVVLLPVGGAGTIDAEQATQVMQQLRPRLMVVPMHYRPSASSTGESGASPSGENKAGENKGSVSKPGVSKPGENHPGPGTPATAKREGGRRGRGKGRAARHSGTGSATAATATASTASVSPTPAAPYGQLAPIDEFLSDKTNIRKVEGFTLTLSPVKPHPGTEIVVFSSVLPGAK